MRKKYQTISSSVILKILFSFFTIFLVTALFAQDSTAVAEEEEAPVVKKNPFTKNTFSGRYMMDNQSVMVNIKGTLEADIQHRFGTVNNGIKDLYGIYSTANMRISFSYVPVNNFEIGFGASNYNMVVDGNIKYAIVKQTTDNSMPVSVTYFGSVAMDTRAKNSSLPIVTTADRFSYFNQILVARKITEKISLQVGGVLTYWNNLPGYYDQDGTIQSQHKNEQFAFSVSGRYKISPKTAVTVNYDQPLTQNAMNNPHPNISFGLDMKSSSHDFQIFAGTYSYTLPQYNRTFNANDFTKGQFLIGFNITRLWNF
jgi:hypothetical protein